jgi:Domain of unknown function (DUF1906)
MRVPAVGRRWQAGIASLALLAGLAVPLAAAQPASATLPAPVTYRGEGFDLETPPPTADMTNWWTTTPYSGLGIYLGGENSGGSNPGHDYIANIMTTGYAVWLYWVGPQSACVNQAGLAEFSNTPSTAQSQGEAQANAAVSEANATGFGNVYIVYDMEAFDTENSTCVTAAESFINGFQYEVHTVDSRQGAVYGSSCGSDLDAYTSHSNVPQAIFPAEYGVSDYSISPIECIGNNQWDHDQRVHQWSQNTRTRFFSGDTGPSVTLNEDCADGPAESRAPWNLGCH